MKLRHEMWDDESEGKYMLCLAGPAGDEARKRLVGKAELAGIIEAESHYEAMTEYYRRREWGEYSSSFPEDYLPYVDVLGNTQ